MGDKPSGWPGCSTAGFSLSAHHTALDVHSCFTSGRCSSYSRVFAFPPPPFSTSLTPPPAVVAFYLAILLPALPILLIVWKVKDDMDDFDEFLGYMRVYFLLFSCVVGFAPALAIGNSTIQKMQSISNFLSHFRCIHDSHTLHSAAVASGAAAAATFIGLLPVISVVSLYLRGSKKFFRTLFICLKKIFYIYAFLPGAALLIGLFPLSIPSYIIIVNFNDDD